MTLKEQEVNLKTMKSALKAQIKVQVLILITLFLIFFSLFPAALALGPHRNYTDDTQACRECHAIHEAPSPVGAVLLKATASTIEQAALATCNLCHGAGGPAVYKPYAQPPLTVQARHSPTLTITSISYLGIGTPETGVPSIRKVLCLACHNPHGTSLYTIPTFTPDTTYGVTNALLRRPGTASLNYALPGAGTTGTPNAYGAQWCRDCHNRPENILSHQLGPAGEPHPYSSTTTYQAVWYWASPTYVQGRLGGTTSAYVMYDRNSIDDPDPICQQCHEDARNVEGVFKVTTATYQSTDNPPYKGFPHQGSLANFRVETGDDLCTNCHPQEELP